MASSRTKAGAEPAATMKMTASGVPGLAGRHPDRRRPGPDVGGAHDPRRSRHRATASWRSASPRARTARPGASASSPGARTRSRCRCAIPVLYFVQRLRDEAHRFAIGSHRARRKKEMIRNPARRDRRHRPEPQARAAAAFRHRQGGQPRRDGGSDGCRRHFGTVAQLVYNHFHER